MVDDGCPKDSQYNPICSSGFSFCLPWISALTDADMFLVILIKKYISDDVLLFSNEVLDQSSDEWLEYFNDSEMYCSSSEMSVLSMLDVFAALSFFSP